MLISSARLRNSCWLRHETDQNRRWIRTVAARDAVGGDDRARRGTRGGVGNRFLLALRSSARSLTRTRCSRDALAARLAHLEDEAWAERASAQPASSADGRQGVRIARLSFQRTDGDGWGRAPTSPTTPHAAFR